MPTLKFRAWHRKHEQMLTVTYLDIAGGDTGKPWLGVAEDIGRDACHYDPGEPSHACDLSEVELMQSTGLKDKNGVEIFEGDVLKSGNDTGIAVVWDGRTAGFGLDKMNWAYRHYFAEAVDSDDCLVIGKIYENPELLAGKESGG